MRKANGMNEFYARTFGEDSFEYFTGKNNRFTLDYPHVHIVHHGYGNVEVIASLSPGTHLWKTTLGNPDGNEVNEAIAKAMKELF